ncbi:O-antigen ligase family protein [Planctomycetota bacterium]
MKLMLAKENKPTSEEASPRSLADYNEDIIESGVLAPSTWYEDRTSLIYCLVGVAVLTVIYIPYRDIHIPPVILQMSAMFIGLICIKFMLENYIYLLLMFVVYAPFQKVLPGDFGGVARAFNTTNLLGLFLFFGWIAQASLHGRRVLRMRKIDVVILSFMFVSTISLIRGYYSFGAETARGESLIFPLKRWLEPMLIYFVFVNNIPHRRYAKLIVTAFLVTMLSCTVIALKQFYLDKGGLTGSFSSLDKMRISGIADQPNQMAAFFCYYGFFYLAFFLVYIRKFGYWVFMPFFIMTYQGMHLCFSRGGQLGFLSGALATLFLWNKKFFTALVVPVLITLIMYPAMIPDRIVGRFRTAVQVNKGDTFSEKDEEKYTFDKTAEERLVIWQAGINMIGDYPLVGVGFKRFKHRIGDYNPEKATKDAHNTYILIASEMGIPALILFLLIICMGFYQAWRVFYLSELLFFKAVALGYMGGVFGLLVVNMFGSRLDSNEVTFYYWILTAVMVRLHELAIEERSRRDKIAQANLPPVRTMLG